MKRTAYILFLVFFLSVFLLGPIMAFASDSSSCYNIQDADARSYCIAKARKEPSACYSIQSASLRSMCLAEVRR